MPQARQRLDIPKPYTTLELNGAVLRFYHGDCLEILASLDKETISAIVTSPPYNLGIEYRTYRDTLPRKDYLAWSDAWIEAAARALEPEGSLFLNVGAKPTDPWTAMDVAQSARRHLRLQNTIHWIKSIAIDRDAGGGGRAEEGHRGRPLQTVNSDRFVNDCHEFIFHFTPEGRTPLDRRAVGVPYQDASNIERWQSGGANRRCRGNTWFIPYQTIQSRDKDRPHPATFPPRVPEQCLKLHGLRRLKLVADPFLGLGSTAVACATLGVDFIGIELDEHYLEEAVARTRAALAAAGEKNPASHDGMPGRTELDRVVPRIDYFSNGQKCSTRICRPRRRSGRPRFGRNALLESDPGAELHLPA